MFLRKLTFSNLRVHKVRFALTICAVALSVSLVVAVTSGFQSVLQTAYKFEEALLGKYDAQLTHDSDTPAGLPQSIVDEIRKDPTVRKVIPRVEEEISLKDSNGKAISGITNVIGVDPRLEGSGDLFEPKFGKWFEGDTGNFAVIDQGAADNLGKKVGDTITIGYGNRNLQLTIVGLVYKPRVLSLMVHAIIYVPLKTSQYFYGVDNPPTLSRAIVHLNTDANPTEWANRWRPVLAKADERIELRLKKEKQDEMARQFQGLELMSYLGGSVSMLAAMFIIFSALSMGVSERQRTLAMMRAIGAVKSQTGNLVLIEGLILATTGSLIGVPLGILFVKILAINNEMIFSAGVVVSISGVIFAVVGTTLIAIAAAVLPAVGAMRVSPLEAMSPLASTPAARTPYLAGLIGLVLVSLDSLIFLAPREWWGREARFYAHFAIGLPGVMLGFFLLSPLFVKAVEAVGSNLVAGILGLNAPLLRKQLSGSIWRAAGTSSALMVGLAIFIAMHVQSNSMLKGWVLPDKFPDIFFYSKGGGITPEQYKAIENTPGIRKDQIMPIGMSATGRIPGFWGVASAYAREKVKHTVIENFMPESTMFFGFDPDRTFDLMQLDFRAGDQETAQKLLKQGGYVLVTQEFREVKGVGVGDEIELQTPVKGVHKFKIAGVIWSPGIDVILARMDVGQKLEKQTVGSVFGSLKDCEEYFGVNMQDIRLFAANLQGGVERDEMLNRINESIGTFNIEAADVRQVKSQIQKGLQSLVWVASSVALAAMLVSLFGVVNTLLASVRSRQWEFGILRSIGLTRVQLEKLVLGEALLLAIVGALLGIASGATLAFGSRQFAGQIIGLYPPVQVPVFWISCGVFLVIILTLIASAIPAWSTGRRQPLELLQAGRAAM